MQKLCMDFKNLQIEIPLCLNSILQQNFQSPVCENQTVRFSKFMMSWARATSKAVETLQAKIRTVQCLLWICVMGKGLGRLWSCAWKVAGCAIAPNGVQLIQVFQCAAALS